MPSVVIKPARDRDEYVVWSTVTESPHGFGDRAQAADLLRWGVRGDPEEPEPVLARVDTVGTSDFTGWGAWDDDGFIFKQVGWLPRPRVFEAARRMGGKACRLRYVLELVDRFDDDDGHYDEVVREYGEDAISLEGERKTAGLAFRQLKRTIEGWNNR